MTYIWPCMTKYMTTYMTYIWPGMTKYDQIWPHDTYMTTYEQIYDHIYMITWQRTTSASLGRILHWRKFPLADFPPQGPPKENVAIKETLKAFFRGPPKEKKNLDFFQKVYLNPKLCRSTSTGNSTRPASNHLDDDDDDYDHLDDDDIWTLTWYIFCL